MRGLLKHLTTRIYFPDEAAANAEDPILKLVPAARRTTLIPKRNGKALEWDIVLQGKGETVFFDY
jgi:protocatechuate 3,4-dioxygenase alpha subunit